MAEKPKINFLDKKGPDTKPAITGNVNPDFSNLPSRRISTTGKVNKYSIPGRKRSALEFLNLGLGAKGAIQGISQKRPELRAPSEFSSIIQPASGDEDLLQRRLNANAQNAAGTIENIKDISGSDVSTAIQGKLGVQANKNQADADALSANAQTLRQEQQREIAQKNADKLFNEQRNRRFDEQQFDIDLQDFDINQSAAAAQIQNAINFEQERNADLINQAVNERAANARLGILDEIQIQNLATQIVLNEGVSMEEALKRAREKGGGLLKFRTFNFNNPN